MVVNLRAFDLKIAFKIAASILAFVILSLNCTAAVAYDDDEDDTDFGELFTTTVVGSTYASTLLVRDLINPAGCDGCIDKKTLDFVRTNYAAIKQDASVGDGEHLRSLASLLRVGPEDTTIFIEYCQSHFDYVFSKDENPTNAAINLAEVALLIVPAWSVRLVDYDHGYDGPKEAVVLTSDGKAQFREGDEKPQRCSFETREFESLSAAIGQFSPTERGVSLGADCKGEMYELDIRARRTNKIYSLLWCDMEFQALPDDLKRVLKPAGLVLTKCSDGLK